MLAQRSSSAVSEMNPSRSLSSLSVSPWIEVQDSPSDNLTSDVSERSLSKELTDDASDRVSSHSFTFCDVSDVIY